VVVVLVCAEWRKGRFNALTAIKALLRSRPFRPGGGREGEGGTVLSPRTAVSARE
jgi:hypothetical protein